MCGICGITDFTGQTSLQTVVEMSRCLRHRGPDMEGSHSFAKCVLGHRRLSILDLSEAAKQPMLSSDGRTALVFNGEIYNFQELREDLEGRGHRFRTTSDTEVVLELYLEKKEAMVDDLNGMFSVAVWDDQEKKLLLARDRLGKKPLYYSAGNGRLSFSSELFSLVQDSAVSRELSEQALFEYLLYDFIPAPHTIFSRVNKLPAAHIAIFDAGGLRVRRYWTPPRPRQDADYDSSKACLVALLEDAVSMRLVSDVPLGAFLSGGIDSTFITALMRKNRSDRVKTFSISFPGTSHDESSWSRLAARALGTEHREYPVNYETQDLFPRIVRHFGEPFGDSSAIPTWHLAERTRRHVTVALSGDGGDELFAGYDRYLARRFQTAYDLLPAPLRTRIIEPMIERLPATTDYYGTSFTKKLKLFMDAARRMRQDPLAAVPRTFSREQVIALTGMDYEVDIDPVLSAARQWIGLDPVSRMLFSDLQSYLAEDILAKVDRMSMAHSLEVRSPLLDYRFVEFACGLPLNFKLSGRTSKRILKDASRDYVPAPILRRSKYGFQVPLGSWMKNELQDWARDRLLSPEHDLFRPDFVEKLWKDHQEGRADNAHRIWLLLIFNEWYSQFQPG
ncbi:MAG: asparagine synthase (glutamine-hydrolyzing) [Deltaproteobacteria bacterium]